tara:strand:- start:994 stop:1230 length:237 start_codon:yes stop_codon:yes gene_type:complete
MCQHKVLSRDAVAIKKHQYSATCSLNREIPDSGSTKSIVWLPCMHDLLRFHRCLGFLHNRRRRISGAIIANDHFKTII